MAGLFDDLLPQRDAAGDAGLFSDLVPKPVEGGFVASVKQGIGSTIKGAGQVVADVVPGAQDNALKRYGQGLIDANPTAVHSLEDMADKPWTTVKEATGNAAGSVGAIVGARALGMGITAMAPLTGPLAPATALVGQAVANLGPAAIAALPSYGGIRDKQMLNDPASNEDWKAKAIAGLGAATVGAIESKFGPQQWALGALTKEGRAALAAKFAETTLAKSVGIGMVKGAAIEGAEEVVQNPIEQLASFDDPTTRESLKDTAFSGLMGAVGGGVLGGGFGLAGGTKKADTADILDAPDVDSAIRAAQTVLALPAPGTLRPGETVLADDRGNAGTAQQFDELRRPRDIVETGVIGAGRNSDVTDVTPKEPLNLPAIPSDPAALLERQMLGGDPMQETLRARQERTDAAARLEAEAEQQKAAELEAIPAIAQEQNTVKAALQRAATVEAPTALQLALERARAPKAAAAEPTPVAAPVPEPKAQELRLVERTPDMIAMPRALAEVRAAASNGEAVRIQNKSGKFAYTVIPKAADGPSPGTVTQPDGTGAVRGLDASAGLESGRSIAAGSGGGDSTPAGAAVVDRTDGLAARPGNADAVAAPVTAESAAVTGEALDKQWTAFADDSGTLNIPRAEMPQIKAEHRGAMVNFLNARDIAHDQDEVPASSLKPTQAEFSPSKVAKAKGYTDTDRSILVSSDGHVLDGHHQWMAKLEAGEPVKVIRLDAPIQQLLETVKEFPSAEQARGTTAAKSKLLAPLDHGELNIPGRTSGIDAELDRYKADQAKTERRITKEKAAERRTDKAAAQELFDELWPAMKAKMGARFGEKQLRETLDSMVKWEPAKFIALAEKFQREQASEAKETPDVAPGPQAAAQEAAPPEQPPAEQAEAVLDAAGSAPVESLGKTGGKGPAGGSTARARAWAANPFRAFLGKHGISKSLTREFAPGETERKASMVQGYGPIFRASGKQVDELAQAAVEEGFLLKADEGELYELVARVFRGERITAQYAQGVAEAEMAARMDRQRQLEEDAGSDVAALSDASLFELDDDAGIPWDTLASNVSTADAMRSLGFTDQEISDATAEGTDGTPQAGQGSAQPVEAAAGQAQESRAGRNDQARPDAEGLTAPTPADVLAQQQRAEDATKAEAKAKKEDAQRAQADAERGEFALTGSDRAADADPNQEVMFSRGPAAGRAFSVTQIQRAVDKLTLNWLKKPDIVILDSMQDAPEPVRKVFEAQNSQGAVGSVEGFHWKGGVYIVADAMNSGRDIIRVLYHESLGHFGLRNTFGKDLDVVLRQVAAVKPKEMKAKAAQYGFDLSNERQRMSCAEELLAEWAQDRPENTLVQKAIAIIRTFLRENVAGFADLKLTDAEIIEQFLAPARNFVENGKRVEPRFSRADEAQASRATDQTQTEAFKRWFGDSKVMDENGEPRVMYHGTNADFTAFREEDRRSSAGFYFTDQPAKAGMYAAARSMDAGRGANVMPVYLRMVNPKRVDFALESEAVAAKAEGHDGLITRNEVVVFSPTQIKSATGNNGQFDPDGADIRFSRATIAGQTSRTYTPEQQRAMRNVGFEVNEPTLKERAQALWQDAGKKLAQGIVDQFAPVKDLDRQAYGLLRLAKGASGAFESFLRGGQLKLTDGVYDFDETKRGGVVDKLLIPLQGEHHDFFRWIAANRAERLKAEGKENLFSAQDIADLKTLANGRTSFDYTVRTGPQAGQVTRDRLRIYADSQRIFNEFNKNALDMAEQSGLIDGASRHLWEHEFYVPFYRVADDADGGVRGMNIKGGVVRQQAFKQLKGGKGALNADLLDNTLMNWAHLLDAAAKNRAAKATLEAAERMGVAIGAPQYTAGQIGAATGNKNGVVWFMDGGAQRFFVVDDPYVLTALTSLEYAGMRNPVMNAMSTFKHALTVGVTASPFFKVRNLIRDSVQVIGTSGINPNVLANVAQGWKLTDPKSDAYFRLLAGGGTIHFGTMLEGSEAKRVQSLVESGVDDSTILNSDQKVKAFYRQFIEPGITAYNELGNRGEAINRASLYQQLRAQGVNHADASLQARDLMDFSMQGSFTTIRFLSQTVPFFNARLVGMYKLGRAAKEDPARFSAVVGAAALMSVGLLLAFGDDDDWKRRTESDRDNFWFFKFGGIAFRIPKPFEIGAIATLAERGFELAFDKQMTGERFRKNVLSLLGSNLSMNPVPQLVKPILDVYANKDSFSGRAIESMGMDKLKPEYRFNDRTSMTARAASTAMNSVTGLVGVDAASPVQIDHMLRGYFGWLGAFIVGAGDVVMRPATGQPSRASQDMWKVATGGMIGDLRDAPSRYIGQMYEQAKEIEEAYGTWRALAKEGKTAEAKEFFEDHKSQLAKYRSVEAVKRAEAKLNERRRIIERSNMGASEKRDLLRAIAGQQERIAKTVVEVR